jgi:LPXTG-motif cell wall-anchored protein
MKRSVSVLLSIIMIISLFVGTVTFGSVGASAAYIVGDVDGDGNITQLDEAGKPIAFGNDFLHNPSPYNIVVRNLIAVELPETGGMGRQVYMWLGLALMLSTLLLYKRSYRKEGRNTS